MDCAVSENCHQQHWKTQRTEMHKVIVAFLAACCKAHAAPACLVVPSLLFIQNVRLRLTVDVAGSF